MKKEPVFENINEDNLNQEMGKGLYYYRLTKNNQKKKWFLKKYENHEKIEKVKNIPENYFRSVGTIARMINQGLVLSGTMENSYNSLVEDIFREADNFEPVKKEKPVEKKKVDRTIEIIGEIEYEIDKFLTNKLKSKFDCGKYLNSRKLSVVDRKKIGNHFEVLRIELEELVNTKNEELEENYGFLTKAQKNKYYDFVTSLVESTEVVKKKRKPRKKKFISPEKRVSKLNFLKEYKHIKKGENYELKSIKPHKIIGAKVLWLYNTKTEKLTYYESTFGFSVKGSSLQNVDLAKMKKVRKPFQVIPNMGTTKAKMKKTFNNLKTKEVNGKERIGKNSVLLKVF